MKTAGLIGGIGPESTIEYYRLILAACRRNGLGAPSLIINSIDVDRMLGLIGSGAMEEVTEYLLGGIERLARAGADFGALAANTPHVVFAALRERSPIPLLGIVEVVRDEAQSRGLTRLGLVGTLFTMQGRFYADVLEPAGITVVVPSPDEQACIHETYMRELVRGLFRAEGRDALLRVAARLAAEERVEGVILGGTELPLLLKDVAEPPVPLLDTTRLHAERIAAELQ